MSVVSLLLACAVSVSPPPGAPEAPAGPEAPGEAVATPDSSVRGFSGKIEAAVVHRVPWSLSVNSGDLRLSAGGQVNAKMRIYGALDLSLGKSGGGLTVWGVGLGGRLEYVAQRFHMGFSLTTGLLTIRPATGRSDLYSLGLGTHVFIGFDVLRTSARRAVYLDAVGGMDWFLGKDNLAMPSFGGALGYRF